MIEGNNVGEFSVLMSIYIQSSPAHLKSCFDSLLSQTLKASEVILVEDGMLLESHHSLINEYKHLLNIISIRNKFNCGLAVSLNNGLKHCDYELVARMDTDDVALINRFEQQYNFMKSNLHISASSGYIQEFDDNGFTSIRELPLDSYSLNKFAKLRSPLSHPAVMFRKSHILAVGGYPLFRNAQDYALWSLLIINGYELANLSKVLVLMRADNEMMKRRGLLHFRNEFKILIFQKKIGFLNSYEFCRNVLFRFLLRIMPLSIKKLIYKNMRSI